MVMIIHFHCKGHGFDPWSGKFHIPPSGPKKKKKKKDLQLGPLVDQLFFWINAGVLLEFPKSCF